MDEQEKITRFKYDLQEEFEREEGHVDSWKKRNDPLYSPNDAVATWEKIRGRNLLPPPMMPLCFVSPTANIPTHERAIWNSEDAYRFGRMTFLVGDIARMSPGDITRDIKIKNRQMRQFFYANVDAQNLPVKRESVDVIWDRKGWLYYLASSRIYADVEDPQKHLLAAFQNYATYLKPGGIIVVDAVEAHDSPPETEPSTVTAAELYVGKEFFQQPFFQTTLPFVDIGEGLRKTRVFIKRE